MEKEYEVTKDIQDLFMEFRAASDCRDAAVKSLFFSKRAIKYAKQALQAKVKAWHLVESLYPELVGKEMYYNFDRKIVILEDIEA